MQRWPLRRYAISRPRSAARHPGRTALRISGQGGIPSLGGGCRQCDACDAGPQYPISLRARLEVGCPAASGGLAAGREDARSSRLLRRELRGFTSPPSPNAHIHRAAANDIEVTKPRGPRLRCNVLFGDRSPGVRDAPAPESTGQRRSGRDQVSAVGLRDRLDTHSIQICQSKTGKSKTAKQQNRQNRAKQGAKQGRSKTGTSNNFR